MKTTVVNITRDNHDIFIGRPSVWGNPFPINFTNTREEVLIEYEQWMRKKSEGALIKLLAPLVGKRLGCFCKPQACHGDVIIKLIDELDMETF